MYDTISVIVPCFNVENYLPECIESIINQTYPNLEIILVNDGSTDDSGIICDKYAALDGRIRVIHQKNGGAANARNAGLRAAGGEYLAFVDGDDFIEPAAYETMLAIMRRYGADLVQCGFREVYPDKREDRIALSKETVFGTKEYLARYTTDWTCGLIWDKLFRRTLFDDIFFEEGHRIDDEFFTYQGVMNAGKIVYAPVVIYDYRQRKSSAMRDPRAREQMLFDRLEYLTTRRKKIVERFPDLKQKYDYAYLDSMLFWARDGSATAPVIREIQRLLKEYFRDNVPCDMKPSFRFQLFQLQHCNSEKAAQKKQPSVDQKEETRYYE